MTNCDEERFAALMLEMAEAVSQEASPFKIEIYFKHLQDMPYEDVERAFQNIIRTRITATFPKVAEIRQAVHGDPQDKALIAWEQLINSIRCVGGYRSIMFDDPAITAIIEREGGWEKVCNMTSEEIKWFGKDFLKMYPSYARRVLSVKKLVGICEARNEIQGIKGYKIEPTMVGNVEKIKALKENNDA
jgi:hypothetical protein